MGRMETWFDTLLSKSPAQPLLLRRANRRLTVLAYHDIKDSKNFARQLDCLTAYKMHPIGSTDLLQALHHGRELPERALFITFDDGDRSVFEVGMPLLRQRQIPAAAFVVAGLLDTDIPFWWDEAKELVRNGGTVKRLPSYSAEDLVRELKKVPDEKRIECMEELRRTASRPVTPKPYLRSNELRLLEEAGITIGHHSLTHPCLPRCPDKKVENEIVLAHEKLMHAVGQPPRIFAYPNGDADARAESVLKTLGYQAGFVFDHRVNNWPVPNPLQISRVRVNSTTTLERFQIILSGLHPVIHRIRGGV